MAQNNLAEACRHFGFSKYTVVFDDYKEADGARLDIRFESLGAVNSSKALKFANLIAVACNLADEFRYKGYVVAWDEEEEKDDSKKGK